MVRLEESYFVSKTDGKKTNKVRLDLLLVERGFAESREKAQAIIFAGQVLVNDQKQDKAGAPVPEDAEIRILGETLRYVGRGGLKLEAALKEFNVSVEGKAALDTGASTGGFTDCLLQHGARKVYAVDVGYGQMAWKIRQDPRVVVIERTNIREMDPARYSRACRHRGHRRFLHFPGKGRACGSGVPQARWGDHSAHQAAVRGGKGARGQGRDRAR